MFLCFALQDGRNWEKKPRTTLKNLLRIANAAEAHELLTQRLDRMNIKSSISVGMVSAIKMGFMISTEKGECKN